MQIRDMQGIFKSIIKSGSIAQCEFCSIDIEGGKCAEKIKSITEGAEVRGTKLDEKNKPKDKCAVCGKKANHIVYIAKSY